VHGEFVNIQYRVDLIVRRPIIFLQMGDFQQSHNYCETHHISEV